MLSFFSFGGSYALGLLFYALIFKFAFVFFAIKQQKNQIKMAKLTPKIEQIRAKYRGRTDQITMRKQQEEIMRLQQEEGYSPLAGCLPLFLLLDQSKKYIPESPGLSPFLPYEYNDTESFEIV